MHPPVSVSVFRALDLTPPRSPRTGVPACHLLEVLYPLVSGFSGVYRSISIRRFASFSLLGFPLVRPVHKPVQQGGASKHSHYESSNLDE
jgi:hypothetical protein